MISVLYSVEECDVKSKGDGSAKKHPWVSREKLIEDCDVKLKSDVSASTHMRPWKKCPYIHTLLTWFCITLCIGSIQKITP